MRRYCMFLCLILSKMGLGQIRIQDKIDLPEKVEETSGIIYFNNEVITFNDSGGEPELYFINPHTGQINRTVLIANATNIDWESITQDDEAIYVGDTGNNSGNRRNLVIYKIYKTDLLNSSSVSAEEIKYRYADQKNFKDQKRKTNFDCEAITVYKNEILIFTKNWGNQKTKIYKIPNTQGDYVAERQETLSIDGMLTSMSYNSNNNTFIGTAYNKNYKSILIRITNYDTSKQNVERIPLFKYIGKANQTEAIAWVDNQQIYITREASKVKIKDKKYKRKQKLILLSLHR